MARAARADVATGLTSGGAQSLRVARTGALKSSGLPFITQKKSPLPSDAPQERMAFSGRFQGAGGRIGRRRQVIPNRDLAFPCAILRLSFSLIGALRVLYPPGEPLLRRA